MYSADDTIVALATPPGRGGLAVVRLSGAAALQIAGHLCAERAALEPRQATLTRLVLDGVQDEAVVTWFQAPHSYTGEDVVELSVHGSPLIAARTLAAARRGGARLASRGEFTLRAYLNGRLDLAQAEAVQDLVSATTPAQARMAYDQLSGALSGRIGEIEAELFGVSAKLEASIDFPEEGYHFAQAGEVAASLRTIEARIDALLREGERGRVLREGATVAVIGRPNVGKSSVFNRLVGSERAIVTEVPGTTRDVLAETVEIGGVPVTIFDTAGARATEDPVEREGVNRAEQARGCADLVVVVFDGGVAPAREDWDVLESTSGRRRVLTINKTDLPAAWQPADLPLPRDEGVLRVSARNGEGMDALRAAIGAGIGAIAGQDAPIIGNVRQLALLERGVAALREARNRLEVGRMPEEFVLSSLQEARSALEELTGQRTTEDLLNEIFSRFCVGK